MFYGVTCERDSFIIIIVLINELKYFRVEIGSDKSCEELFPTQ